MMQQINSNIGRGKECSSQSAACGCTCTIVKAFPLPAVNGAMCVLMVLAASRADAQLFPVAPPPPHAHIHGFRVPLIVVERETIIEREVAPPDKPAEKPVTPEPPPPPRKPYVIGASYRSLPGGCMKLIERGASYYLCSGEWYRQVGSGSGAQYKAVAKP